MTNVVKGHQQGLVGKYTPASQLYHTSHAVVERPVNDAHKVVIALPRGFIS